MLLTARTEPHVDRPLRSPVTSVVYRTPTRSSGEHCPSLNLPAKKFELRHGVRRPSLQFGVHKMRGLCAKIARPEKNPCLGQENKPIKSWSNFGRTALPDVPTTTDEIQRLKEWIAKIGASHCPVCRAPIEWQSAPSVLLLRCFRCGNSNQWQNL